VVVENAPNISSDSAEKYDFRLFELASRMMRIDEKNRPLSRIFVPRSLIKMLRFDQNRIRIFEHSAL